MYAIVDIETTGGHASANGITEIAVYVYNGREVINHFTTLINPGQNIPTYITALTGISNAMVASAPSFEEVAERINSLLSTNIFVAHNVNFDYSFLRYHLKQAGYELNVKKLCTVRLSRKIFSGLGSYSLGNLCRSLRIGIENRHRADGDAKATTILFGRILQEGGQEHITAMLKRSSSEQWLPLNLERKVINELPYSAGVYYFHDGKGKIIYVGKAVNIRKRVISHFTSNNTGNRRQNFLRLVNNITCTTCTSELHALVLESTEIKRLWPKYNYSQKQPDRKFGLYSFEDGRGYIRLAIDKKKKNLAALYHFNLLHEGLVLMKKMVDEFQLNHKLCFLDKSPLQQADLQVLPEPVEYNQRVKEAVASLNKKLPTFAIVEEGLTPGQKLCLLIERGCFYGMGYVHEEQVLSNLDVLKDVLSPYADNDFIRNRIYSFAAEYPHKRIMFDHIAQPSRTTVIHNT
ncbi:MAG: exonuclease domain-containing protein [Ferruginibacter sp.]